MNRHQALAKLRQSIIDSDKYEFLMAEFLRCKDSELIAYASKVENCDCRMVHFTEKNGKVAREASCVNPGVRTIVCTRKIFAQCRFKRRLDFKRICPPVGEKIVLDLSE